MLWNKENYAFHFKVEIFPYCPYISFSWKNFLTWYNYHILRYFALKNCDIILTQKSNWEYNNYIWNMYGFTSICSSLCLVTKESNCRIWHLGYNSLKLNAKELCRYQHFLGIRKICQKRKGVILVSAENTSAVLLWIAVLKSTVNTKKLSSIFYTLRKSICT